MLAEMEVPIGEVDKAPEDGVFKSKTTSTVLQDVISSSRFTFPADKTQARVSEHPANSRLSHLDTSQSTSNIQHGPMVRQLEIDMYTHDLVECTRQCVA